MLQFLLFWTLSLRRRHFKFENWWHLEKDYNVTAKQSWLKSSNRPFHLKTHCLAQDHTKWCKTKPKPSLNYRILRTRSRTSRCFPLTLITLPFKKSLNTSTRLPLPKKMPTTNRDIKRTALLRGTEIPASFTKL